MHRRRRSGLLLSSVASLACLAGCQSEPRTPAPLQNFDFAGSLNLPGSQPAARSQKPPTKPTLPQLGDGGPANKAAKTARIRAVVNDDAILEEEVAASAIQQLMAARSDREKAEILNKKLNEIIERELLLQDASRRLAKRGNVMEELKSAADKEFDRQWVQRIMRANGYTDPVAFKRFLEDQGMPVAMIHRQWVRNFIAMEYVRSRVEPSVSRIGHLEIVDYYGKNADEFRVDDSVVWQDLFVAHARHGGSVEASRRFAESLVARLRKGEDFVKLSRAFDNGESSLRKDSAGVGQKRGEIRPVEAEPVLFSLKDGEVGPLVENESGFHVVRVIKRTYKGVRPLDEAVQKEIRDKLRGKVFEKEMKKIISDLKATAIIEVVDKLD